VAIAVRRFVRDIDNHSWVIEMIHIDEFVQGHPATADIEARVATKQPLDFEAERMFLKKIAESGFAQYAVSQALKRVSQSDDFQLSNFIVAGSVQIWPFMITDLFAMSLVIRDPAMDAKNLVSGETPPFRIQPYPYDAFIQVVQGSEATLHQYRVSETGTKPSLVKCGEVNLLTGVCVLVPAATHAVSFETENLLITLEVTGPITHTIMPMFDSASLGLDGYISTDPTASRLELLTYTLAEFRNRDSFDRVATLTEHREHYVRWNATRHLLRIDANRARPYVEKALADVHEEVRDAAQATLKRFFS
jgi:hypothetical protein